MISLTVLPRLTPRAAAETCLGGEVFDAPEAARMGLVTRAVPGESLDDEVAASVASLTTGAPRGCARPSDCSTRACSARIDAGAEEMATLSARLFGSEAAREAMTAFLSRRR